MLTVPARKALKAVWPYALALAVSGLAFVISSHFSDVLRPTPFVVFVPAVAFAAWFGLGPGILAAIACTVEIEYLYLPIGRTVGYFFFSLLVCLFVGRLASERKRAEQAERDARGAQQQSVQDLTRLQKAQSELRTRLEQQAAVAALGQEALAGASTEQLLEMAVRVTAVNLRTDYSQVFRLQPNGQALEAVAAYGVPDGVKHEMVVGSPDASQAGYTLATNGPVIVEDFDRETRFPISPRLRELGAVSGMSVVIPSRERPFGILSAHTVVSRGFGEDDANFLNAIAHVLAAALERRQAEESLQQQLTLTATLTANLAEGVCALDRDGRVIFANPTAASMLGWTNQDLLAADFHEKVHTGMNHGQTGCALMRTLEARNPCRVEEDLFIRGGGGAFPVTYAASPLGQETATGGCVLVFDDITQRKHVQDAVRRSEARLRALIENGSDVINVVDERGCMSYASPSVTRVLGFTPEELMTRRSLDFVHPDDRAAVKALFADLLRQPGVTASLEYRLRHADGSWRFVEASETNLLHDPDVNGIVTNFRDVTERRLVEEALHQSDERYRNIVDTANEGIMVVDPDAQVVFVNPRMTELLGYSLEEMVGQSLFQFMDEAEGALARSQMERRKRGTREQYDARLRRKDGSDLWAITSASPIFDGGGEYAGFIGMVTDVTDRKRAEEALAHQALHDMLTDLPNRVLLQDRMEQAILIARRDRKRLGVLVMDLDGFKEVNDTFGHHYGDQVLRQVGLRLRHMLRRSDTVARLGGDEFAILLPAATGVADAVLAARKMLNGLERPFAIEGHSFEVGASVGVVIYPDHGSDVQTLMRHADVAMYAAKRSREGFAVYAAEHDATSPDRLTLTAELRRAIEHNELVLYFQPKVDFRTGRLGWVEALVRWKHPERGLLGPDEFIPLAEQTGLIKPLSSWVIEEAVRQRQAWQERELPIGMAVNVSMRNLHDPQLPETIAGLLKICDLEPGQLMVEITESTLMADPTRALQVVTELARLGIKLSIDDFGTGYSSLAYLKRLPVAEIKIDKSFVLDMVEDENDAVIVRSTIDMAHNLGLEVVAEGVETQEVWDRLAALGCDVAQGYLLGAPMTAADLERWARESRWGLAGSAKGG